MLAESKTEIPVKLKLIHKQKLPTGVLASSLVSDGASLIAGCMNGVFRADFADSKHEQLYEHSSYVSSVHWLAEQKLILSAGYDGNVSWYDTESNRIARRESMHDFWSWDMAVSPDGSVAASVTGQYLAGGYKYEPLPEREPSLKLFAIKSGEVLHELPHVPSVQAVAFSPDGQLVAAANIMGEVRVWNVKSGERVCEFTTPDFTSWGIIKSHCYLGGIFSLIFTPDSSNLLLAGMGPMRDPMAGNGKQLWQRWSIEESPSKTAEIRRKDAGEGLMENTRRSSRRNSVCYGWPFARWRLECGDL